MENNTSKTLERTFTGIVESDVQDKTIVVKVSRMVVHPKYKKRYTVSRKYQVHDPENRFAIGDEVIFKECRPLSKSKRWRVDYSGSSVEAKSGDEDNK